MDSIRERLQPHETIALHARAEINLPNVRTFERLTAPSVLERSMLSLTHGGTGSTYQALQKGVPVVIWPKHLNQQRLGELLQERGLGVLLDGKGWEHDVDRLIDQWDSLRRRVRTEAGRPLMRNGPSRAANVIESLMGMSVAPERANATTAPVASPQDKNVQAKDAALKEARKRERSLRRKLTDSERQRERAQRELQAVYASYSWSITSPIRVLMDYVHKLLVRMQ